LALYFGFEFGRPHGTSVAKFTRNLEFAPGILDLKQFDCVHDEQMHDCIGMFVGGPIVLLRIAARENGEFLDIGMQQHIPVVLIVAARLFVQVVAVGEACQFPEGFPLDAPVDVVLGDVHFGLCFLNNVHPNIVGLVECKSQLVFSPILH